MASETVVAVFSSLAHAEAAISDLVEAGVPATSIKHYARDAADVGTETTRMEADSGHHGGFWAWLTGQESTQEHHDVYDRSMQSGHTVVTVIGDGSNVDHIYTILERHNPVDLEEQDAAYGTAGGATAGAMGASTTSTTTTATTGYADSVAGSTAIPAFEPRKASATDTTRTGGAEEVIPLSEEMLQVGKRMVDRGTTRIRRYVVERPVEEQVRLRDETVSVFRRPVTGAATVGADAFREQEIVVNQTAEEAVVGKTAHVVEEVVVQKGVEERVEAVHGTVRREEVEIEGPATKGTDTVRKPGSTI
jgi:uncharacterized protein (TIGR02271 family)